MPDQTFLTPEIGQRLGELLLKKLDEPMQDLEPQAGCVFDQVHQVGLEKAHQVRPCGRHDGGRTGRSVNQ